MLMIASVLLKFADECRSTAGRLENALDPGTSGSVMGKQSVQENFPQASLYRKNLSEYGRK